VYKDPVSLCHNIVRLIPRNTNGQFCKNAMIKISPEPDTMNEYEDFFGNKVIYFSIEKEHWELTVHVTSEVERNVSGQIKMNMYRNATLDEVKHELLGMKSGAAEIRQYIYDTPMTAWNEEILAYTLESFADNRPVFEATEDLIRRIYTDFEYKPGVTTVSTPLSTVMKQRKGVCQDFAHLAISCLRSVGLPVRYVSGYIETISPAGVEKLVGVDASHAWFSVYIPNMGWTDFDPTNNCIVSDQHITIGWGRDYADIAPFEGIILSSGSHDLSVSVDVRGDR
jgi:transglutaminase-like putative cysteine protease